MDGSQDDLNTPLDEAENLKTMPIGNVTQAKGVDLDDADETLPSHSPPSIRRIGRYKLIQKLGEGGMGTVWMAEQHEPVKRRVALKLIKDGSSSNDVIARFEAERQALAMMNHQNIAHILDAGTSDDGQPFFVMELIQGVPITKFCDDNKLTIQQRLNLFVAVCDAIQHAHQKGIIHRDLKPSNILVTHYDGKPVPKVIDFGLAKALQHQTQLTEKTLYTQIGQVVGTLQYMSPEQAELYSLDIDTRTDIYSLGVILYELLTGSTPIPKESVHQQAVLEVLMAIREKDPPRPSARLIGDDSLTVTLRRQIPLTKLREILKGDLDWIVMKAIEKDRTRRYATAAAFAEDITKYLDGDVVEARPPSTGYLLRKFAKKNRRLAGSLALVASTLICATAISVWFGIEAQMARRKSTESEKLAIIEKDAADKARRSAEEQQRLVLEQKQVAEQLALEKVKLANDAKLTASIAEARYFISKGDLPSAWKRLQQANAIGMKFSDRVIFDEFYQASRQDWKLIDVAKTNSKLVAFVEPEAFMAYVEGRHLKLHGAHGTPKAIDLAVYPKDLVPIGDHRLLVVTERELLAVQCLPEVEITNRIKLDSSIIKYAVSQSRVLLGCSDKSLRLLELATLAETERWNWKDLPCDFGLTSATKIFLSPNSRFILLHMAPWTTPAVLIDRSVQPAEIKKLGEGQVELGEFGQLVFDEYVDGKCYGWFSPSADGGLPDLVWSLDLTNLSDANIFRPESAITKTQKAIRIDDDQVLTLVGETGMSFVSVNGEVPVKAIRFDAIWPFDDKAPEVLAVDKEAGRIALQCDSGICVFDFQYRVHNNSDNWCTTATDKGVLSFANTDASPTLSFDYFDAMRDPYRVQPQWITSVSGNWFPWGCDISSDEKTAVVLAQETDYSDMISSTYRRKRAVFYDVSGGISDPESWKIVREFVLEELEYLHGFENREIHLSQDCSMLFILHDKDLYCYECQTGKLLRQVSASWVAFTDDDELMAISSPKGEIQVLKTNSLDAVAKAEVDAQRGGCFTTDGKQLLVGSVGPSIVCMDVATCKTIWQKPTAFIPKAWHPNEPIFVGLLQEDNGRGASLAIADKESMEKLAILSDTGGVRSKARFSADGNTLFFDQHRWNYGVLHFPSFEALMTRMTSNYGINYNVDAVGTAIDVSKSAPVEEIAKVEVNDIELEITSIEAIQKLNDSLVGIEGRIEDVTLTRAKNAANIITDLGPAGKLLIWVPPTIFTHIGALNKTGLPGMRFKAKGKLSTYGGRSERFKSMMQLTIERPEDLLFLDE